MQLKTITVVDSFKTKKKKTQFEEDTNAEEAIFSQQILARIETVPCSLNINEMIEINEEQ